MADIALVTANKVNVGTLTVIQHTVPAAEAITAGAPVLFDANGKFVNSDANATGLKGVWGIATRTVVAGEALTAVRAGLLTGFDLSAMAFGASAFASDTVGRIADAAGTTSIVVGHVVPIWGQSLGSTPDKGLMVQVTTPPVSA